MIAGWRWPTGWSVTCTIWCASRRGFSGGELRPFDRGVEQVRWVPAETFREIVPEDNLLVLFPSSALHEIRPVRCPSRAFADSRFTLNGWLRGEHE